MKKYFPKPVFVVNRPGGAGTVGTAEIIAAKPDGYTIGTSTMSALTIKPHQTMGLPYKTPDDYFDRAYVMENGGIVLEGEGLELLQRKEVMQHYFGGGYKRENQETKFSWGVWMESKC